MHEYTRYKWTGHLQLLYYISISKVFGLIVASKFPGASLVDQLGKNPPDVWETSWVRKTPRRRGRLPTPVFLGFPSGSVKNLPAMRETGFDPWAGKIRRRRAWQPTPVFLPGESHGQEPGGLRPMGSQRVRHD